MSVLPQAAWREEAGLQRILSALADDLGGPMAVGGAVRDTLLGQEVTDIDLATPLHPPVVIERLTQAGVKTFPTGIDHGTITAVADGKNYEITTLRRDVATDGRRATIAFADNWREDAERRDFTFNALYADPRSGKIIDYFGGIDDLRSGAVRFIGDPAARIAEDHLRTLRYFRFLARFGNGSINEAAIEACRNAAHSLTALSRERIAQELLKTLAAANPVNAVSLMQDNGIFAPFLPDLSDGAAASLGKLVEREAVFRLAPSLVARLLAILPRNATTVEKVAARLKLSNRMREGMADRLSTEPSPDGMRAFAYRKNVAAARDAALLFASNVEVGACLAALDGWEPPAFAIKGSDLLARGLTAGPIVARTLRSIENRWVEEGFPAAPRQREMADQAASAALLDSRKA